MVAAEADGGQGAVGQTIAGQTAVKEVAGRPFHFVPDVGWGGKSGGGQPVFQDGQVVVETAVFIAVRPLADQACTERSEVAVTMASGRIWRRCSSTSMATESTPIPLETITGASAGSGPWRRPSVRVTVGGNKGSWRIGRPPVSRAARRLPIQLVELVAETELVEGRCPERVEGRCPERVEGRCPERVEGIVGVL
jgi:hypothetical protein